MNRSWHFHLRKNRHKFDLVADDSNDVPSVAGSTMDPTTLLTFLFRAPPEAQTVELFGSWDNFQQPYPMLHDRRRGKGFWSGCFTFNNIIFDGDSLSWSKPRSGGLKQGGTYWYFYRLNDTAEAYDDTQFYTTSCPLLPGQRLNMIEVPVELVDVPSRCVSAGGAFADDLATVTSGHTLDPAHKFAPLAPPPLSKVHGRCHSDLAVNGRLENRPHSSNAKRLSTPVSPTSKCEETARPTSQRSSRIYGGDALDLDGYSERQDSMNSYDTRYPEARSFVSSSVVDVQARAFSGLSSELGDLSPVLEMSSPMSGPATSAVYEEDVAPQFSNSDPFHDFDQQHVDYEDDFDALIQLPPSTPEFDDCVSSSGRRNAFEDDSHQYYDSQQDLGHVRNEPQRSTDISPRLSGEHQREYQPTPFDVLSPSFSAATMSSAGISTPFHLSAGCSRTASVHTPENEHDATVDRLTAELRRLKSSYSESTARSPPMYERKDPSMSGYSLPPAVFSNSGASGQKRDTGLLGKTSLAASNISVVSPPETSLLPAWEVPSLLATETESSFADNVFSELTFFQ